MSKSKCQIKSKAPMTQNERFGFWILDLIRTHLKNHFGCNQRISAATVFSELIVFPIRFVPAAAVSLRNSLDFALKAIFEMGSRHLKFGFRISQRGFTMVEVVVMLFVVMMVSAIVLANFPGVSESINAQKSAQRLALSIRRAQSQALAVREVSVDGAEVIAPAFGVHIREAAPTEYVFFADRNGDLQYRDFDDSLIETSLLERGVSFSEFRDENDQFLSVINVMFRAPGGDMVLSDAEGVIGESALITVRVGSEGVSRSVRVRTSGQVAVE